MQPIYTKLISRHRWVELVTLHPLWRVDFRAKHSFLCLLVTVYGLIKNLIRWNGVWYERRRPWPYCFTTNMWMQKNKKNNQTIQLIILSKRSYLSVKSQSLLKGNWSKNWKTDNLVSQDPALYLQIMHSYSDMFLYRWGFTVNIIASIIEKYLEIFKNIFWGKQQQKVFSTHFTTFTKTSIDNGYTAGVIPTPSQRVATAVLGCLSAIA